MARRKEDLLDRLIGGFSLRGTLVHPGTLFVLVTALTIFGALRLWDRYQHRLVPAAEYQLTADRVRITPAPKWANVNLKRLLLEVPNGRPAPTILDTDVVSKAAATLNSVGWIEQVQRIRKSADGLDIDVAYRQPVGVVELNSTNIPGWKRTRTAQVMPVDRNGMVMPAHLMKQVELPVISVFNPQGFSRLTPWIVWPDARVVDCANIMALFGPRVKELGVYRVMTMRSNQPALAQVPYELWPAQGTQVVWGNAPGKETVGEANAQTKLRALLQFVQQHGPLSQMPKRRADVRSGKIVITQDAHVAEKDDIFGDLK